METNESKTESKITNNIIYNLIIFLFFVLWFFYSTFDFIPILIIICFSILFLAVCSLIKNLREGIELGGKILYILLILIPITFLVDIIFFYEALTPPFLIDFYDLIGLKHNHEFFLILILSLIIFLKLIGIKIYFSRSLRIDSDWKGDEIFEFFSENITSKKLTYLIILLSLGAFVEELIYRSLFLTIFVFYLNWNLIFSIFFISGIFGIVHYSSSNNLGHVFSTLISSIIYFYALINLGLLYPWVFHFLTNLFVVLFYLQNKKTKQ